MKTIRFNRQLRVCFSGKLRYRVFFYITLPAKNVHEVSLFETYRSVRRQQTAKSEQSKKKERNLIKKWVYVKKILIRIMVI